MKRKLYPNMKRLTTMFCIAIACTTMATLLLRLTLFSDMAVFASPSGGKAVVEQSENGTYTINQAIHFDTPQSKGNIMVKNHDGNPFYLTVNIMLPDTKDTVISTGFIKPGETRETASLTVSLEDGTYECVAEITAFDPDTLDLLTSEECAVTLYVGA